MCLFAANELPARRQGAAGSCNLRLGAVARGNQCAQVSDGATLNEYAAGVGVKTNLAGQPAEYLVFCENCARTLEPRATING